MAKIKKIAIISASKNEKGAVQRRINIPQNITELKAGDYISFIQEGKEVKIQKVEI